MSDLGFNKIAGATLATALAAIGLSQLSKILYQPEPAILLNPRSLMCAREPL